MKTPLNFRSTVTSDRFDRNPINKPPFPKELRDWLESIQPYKASEATNSDHLDLIKGLHLLHDCARKDRHRRLHVVGAVPTFMEYLFELVPDGPGKITFVHPIRANYFEDETIFLQFGMEGFVPEITQKINLKTAVKIEVAVDEIPVADGDSVDAAMRRLVEAVECVVRYFEGGYGYLSAV